ncbi:hypothetical protein [Marinoscillum furvescens]|uniref:Uncharacterized protein n=1 Tax=Marinoscillum furvescens DSM 4134 TaxID=1122208 RepID=A0A3D9L499_MARFU|nr:hypothetical protein [Marinoscillum furvescens]REE00185.1 hypothetical protein C7460_106124 [Marinoscillum furvescens DSM 4134]
MNLLYPTQNKEVPISDKESVLERIKAYTENVKKFRFIFSGHKPFEGEVKQNGFNIKYIGKTARNYKVELQGDVVEDNNNTVLRIQSRPTGFGKIYTLIWLFIMTLVTVLTIYLTISQGQLIILTFTLVCVLLLTVVLTVSYYGYRNETSKVWELIENIVSDQSK